MDISRAVQLWRKTQFSHGLDEVNKIPIKGRAVSEGRGIQAGSMGFVELHYATS